MGNLVRRCHQAAIVAAALLCGACHALYPFDVDPVDVSDSGVQVEDQGAGVDGSRDGEVLEDEGTKPDQILNKDKGGPKLDLGAALDKNVKPPDLKLALDKGGSKLDKSVPAPDLKLKPDSGSPPPDVWPGPDVVSPPDSAGPPDAGADLPLPPLDASPPDAPGQPPDLEPTDSWIPDLPLDQSTDYDLPSSPDTGGGRPSDSQGNAN